MARVRLIVPPVLAVTRPSLGVSLLKASLDRAGIACAVDYANITFAAEIGPDLNETLAERTDTRVLLGEWIFSHALVPERSGRDDTGYLAHAARSVPAEVLEGARLAAAGAAAFVQRTAQAAVRGDVAIVGLSTTFQQNAATLAIAREIKRLRPELQVCIGGANCEGDMGEALAEAYPFLDAVFAGEADTIFTDYVAQVLAGQAPDGRLRRGRPLMRMDDAEVPDFSDYFAALDTAALAGEVRPALLFESSRGCWWGARHHCKFCGLNGTTMTFRAKSRTRIESELATLRDRWRINNFLATDNILDHSLIDTMFGNMAESESGYTLFYEIKSNISHAQLATLRRAGVKYVQPGIESLHDATLKEMDKGVTGLRNIRLLRNCRELGIMPIWNMLRGFPGETDAHFAEIAAQVPYLQHLSPPKGPFPIRIDRFSPYFEAPEAHGFSDVRPMRAYAHIYDLPPAMLERIAYFFEGKRAEAATAEAVAGLAAAVGRWRGRYLEPRAQWPMLNLLDLGQIAFVKDTRDVAEHENYCLDRADVAVLRAFRDPRKRAAGLERARADAMDLGADEAAKAFHKLARLKLILTSGDVSLSLVADSAFVLDLPQAPEENPFGEFVPSD